MREWKGEKVQDARWWEMDAVRESEESQRISMRDRESDNIEKNKMIIDKNERERVPLPFPLNPSHWTHHSPRLEEGGEWNTDVERKRERDREWYKK